MTRRDFSVVFLPLGWEFCVVVVIVQQGARVLLGGLVPPRSMAEVYQNNGSAADVFTVFPPSEIS